MPACGAVALPGGRVLWRMRRDARERGEVEVEALEAWLGLGLGFANPDPNLPTALAPFTSAACPPLASLVAVRVLAPPAPLASSSSSPSWSPANSACKRLGLGLG